MAQNATKPHQFSGKIETPLDALMRDRHISERGLARATGLQRSAIRRLRKGQASGIHFSTLAILCAFLKVEAGSILVFVERPGRARVTSGRQPGTLSTRPRVARR